ncbi:MAG: sulfatase [Labilithrix sp.]|nr:sulfatase [Labilithrix sp.]
MIRFGPLAIAAAMSLAACSSCEQKAPPPPAEKAASAHADASLHDGGDGAAKTASLTDAPWNILLITVDSLRADMPWAGYERPIAPRLSALHAKSTRYTRAYSTSSYTSKSLAGLLTGRYPSELSRTGVFFTRYLTKTDFVCTAFGSAGVPCVGGHAHAYFGPKQSGFEHGFSDWRIVKGITFDYQTDPYVTSDKLTPLAIEMLGEVASKQGTQGPKPFLAWFHYMDPHDEYKTHAESPHFGKRARDLYDEEVFFTDQWIGKLLDFVDAQPWAARTIVVVTADHGEAFGEHGMTRHAHEVWEELVHVPLFFYVPGRAARTIDEPRGHVDLAPTFAALLGVSVELPGASLVAELDGAPAPARDVVVDLPEDEYNERRRALVHGTTKIIAFGNDVRYSLFDLAADPQEKQDLWRSRPELAADMKARYKAASARIRDVAPAGGIPKHDR